MFRLIYALETSGVLQSETEKKVNYQRRKCRLSVISITQSLYICRKHLCNNILNLDHSDGGRIRTKDFFLSFLGACLSFSSITTEITNICQVDKIHASEKITGCLIKGIL